MTIYLRRLMPLVFVIGAIPCLSQSTLGHISRDTIIIRQELLGNAFYLDGKRLNLAVMEWFMSDYPGAYSPIRGAVISDQLSVATYATGGLFALTGVLIREDDLNLSNDMLKLGILSGAAGVVFQVIEIAFKKNAVTKYNECIREHHQRESGIRVGVGDGRVKIGWRFD